MESCALIHKAHSGRGTWDISKFYLPNHIIGISPMVMAGVNNQSDSDDEVHMVYESEGEMAAAPDYDPADMEYSDDDDVQIYAGRRGVHSGTSSKGGSRGRKDSSGDTTGTDASQSRRSKGRSSEDKGHSI